jgi:EAL and modified HD-GYP domain-containing signal transduction protein
VKPWKFAPSAPAERASEASGPPSSAAGAYVVRQPIFGSNDDVAGYELLYHPAATEPAKRGRRDPIAPTSVHACVDVGLEKLTSGRPAFISFTRETLLARAYTLVSHDAVVIGVPGRVRPDRITEQVCEELVNDGYVLALDDFVWSSYCPRLLELTPIVKVDVLNQSPETLDELAQRLAVYDVRLLAKRVETAEARATCAGLGYELFQGGYYAHPETVASRSLTSDEMEIVRAVNVIRDDWASHSGRDADTGTDPVLCDLLRIVTSTARGTANREVLHLAVQRARMCELLAGPSSWDGESRSLFLVGLLSLLDTLSGTPIPELLKALAPAPALRDALVSRVGPYAAALRLTEAYEQGLWPTVGRLAQRLGMDAAQVAACYIQSLAWTRDQLRSLATA